MAWEHLSITKPHLVYIILGGFTSLFMLCSSVIKERMYIGEATVATLCGLIFGPHAANLINPQEWGNVDIVTIEFSRIVLVVQCFAVGVELPKFYMEKHWRSVVFLLLPVMTFGWLITSLFVWWMVPPLNWLESLVVAACVTATDPVLASSVVGKGKFAKRVPKHLRDLLSAESGCNDGMAFPFIYLSLYLIHYHQSARDVSFNWVVVTILYECIFGAVYGFLVGYIARHGIKLAEKYDLIDRESFLVFYFVLALFCAGSGSILGVDDLLVGFACGVGFSNDGWFTTKTEESHVSNVIDLLLNLAYFVYLGTIIPWEQFNNTAIGLSAWRLTIIAIFVILFRRIPIMMALKPLIPDIKTWREALFAGHFGPIGVGAIFVAIMARAELEHDEPVPLAELPDPSVENYTLLTLVWPIVTFLVVASIIVHGSSVAVFTLGKHINTLTITMSYTQANDDGPSWMNRLPRITSTSRSQARISMSDTDVDELKLPEFPPGTLPPVGIPGQFLRRVREDEKDGTNPRRSNSRPSSLASRRRKKKWDDGMGPGGPISVSAIFPQRRSQSDMTTLQGDASSQAPTELAADGSLLSPTDALSPRGRSKERRRRSRDPEKRRAERGASSSDAETIRSPSRRRSSVPEGIEIYDEGNNIVVENEEGDVLAVEPTHVPSNIRHAGDLQSRLSEEAGGSVMSWAAIKKRLGEWRDGEIQKRKEKEKHSRKHEPARAYQFGNTIIVEDEDGEVVKKYELPAPPRPEGSGNDIVSQGLKYMGMGGGRPKPGEKSNSPKPDVAESSSEQHTPPTADEKPTGFTRITSRPTFFGRQAAGEPSSSSARPTTRPRKKSVAEEVEEEDDRHIRFTIGGVGQRMTKDDFINEMQKLDKTTRREVVDQSSASHVVKTLAKQDPQAKGKTQGTRAVQQQQQQRGKAVASASGGVSSGSSATKAEKAPLKEEEQDAGASSDKSSETKDGSRERTPPPGTIPEEDDSKAPSRFAPETAVERRRRMEVLQGQQSDDDVGETPAERRRREAALGVSSSRGTEGEEDSDDDDTQRIPPARRGIRFADAVERRVG